MNNNVAIPPAPCRRRRMQAQGMARYGWEGFERVSI